MFSQLPDVVLQDLKEKPWPSLILVLIYERLQGSSSSWAPYVNILPTDADFSTLMYWNEDELKELQASAIVDKIDKDLECQGV